MTDDMQKARELATEYMLAHGTDDSAAGFAAVIDAIAAALREAREQAWDHGYGDGWEDGHEGRSPNDRLNPYREPDATE